MACWVQGVGAVEAETSFASVLGKRADSARVAAEELVALRDECDS